MFTSISWQNYFTIAGSLSATYYLYVGVRYFRQDVTNWVSGIASRNTQAPSHLLIVQKNANKEKISWQEDFLNIVEDRHNEFGKYPKNYFISIREHDLIVGNEHKAGTNQHGRATEVIWQNGSIDGIGKPLYASLEQLRYYQKYGVPCAYSTES